MSAVVRIGRGVVGTSFASNSPDDRDALGWLAWAPVWSATGTVRVMVSDLLRDRAPCVAVDGVWAEILDAVPHDGPVARAGCRRGSTGRVVVKSAIVRDPPDVDLFVKALMELARDANRDLPK